MSAAPSLPPNNDIHDVDTLILGFERLGYVADRALATAIYLSTRLRKPLLIEGHAGLGKTEVAKVLASLLGTRLIRLQCYEGLDVSSAVYEWNYQKQLLAIKLQEKSEQTIEEKEKHIFSKEFLLERPLLLSILEEKPRPYYSSTRSIVPTRRLKLSCWSCSPIFKLRCLSWVRSKRNTSRMSSSPPIAAAN